MRAFVTEVENVEKHPAAEADRLTIVTVAVNGDKHRVVADLQDDGTPRWTKGEPCVYIPENAIVPEDVLKERGYWVEGEKKGPLGGSKGNRVKMRRFAGFESRGLLFKVNAYDGGNPEPDHFVTRGSERRTCDVGDDVGAFFGLTEYVAA